jgi:hypothetical protein
MESQKKGLVYSISVMSLEVFLVNESRRNRNAIAEWKRKERIKEHAPGGLALVGFGQP